MRRILIALALSAAGIAHAATVSFFSNLGAWEAAISGAAQVQDFSGYATGTDLTGVSVLPGVTLTSSIGPVEVFGASKSAMAFGPRTNTYYDAYYELPFMAAALDITGFESNPNDPSTAAGPGSILFMFSDGSAHGISIAGNTLGSPRFVGVVSDIAIVSFRWVEAYEYDGGNEETGLDNLRVAMRTTADPQPLPLPGSLPLAMLALGLVPLVRRR
ncbi:MAG: hypothetical protein HY020_05880 [Burkholderiales bacterium]|nr:hypothetical protein [Burkholderiales bacterium]